MAGCHFAKRRDDARSGVGMGPRDRQKGIIRRREEKTHSLGQKRGAISSEGCHSETRRDNAHAEGGTRRESIRRALFGDKKR